ncbi:hypothetical protein QGM60_16460 [Winogradskyella sp. SYSU M77433]|nr:hypothetical protein [Winogradskyella sp. SYSU M77433]
MGFPVFIFEILLILITSPLLIYVYFLVFRKSLKKLSVNKSIAIHYIMITGLVILGIVTSNLLRLILGITSIYLPLEYENIRQFGHLLWFTPYEQKPTIEIIAYISVIILNIFVTYKIIRFYEMRSLKMLAKNYALFTTLIFNTPIILSKIFQIILAFYYIS